MTDHLQQVREAEDRRYEAMLQGDLDTLDELCSADLIYTHSNADRDTKDSYLEKVRNGHFVYQEIEHPVSSIVLTGDTAIVAGDMRARVINGGELRHLNNSALAVWTRVDGTWRFVAYQPTPYPVAAPDAP